LPGSRRSFLLEHTLLYAYRYRLLRFPKSLIPASFFFSSRRRHTRFSRDWSSDVCSSDLTYASHHSSKASAEPSMPSNLSRKHARSEERRVGKESRSRWSPHRYKKKSRLQACTRIKRRRIGPRLACA